MISNYASLSFCHKLFFKSLSPKLDKDDIKITSVSSLLISSFISCLSSSSNKSHFVSAITLSLSNKSALYFLSSLLGKFFILGLTWSFSFQVLSEVRHLIMDLGYGFELRTSKITGLIVIIGSIVLTIFFYLIGKNFI